jgi:hypothetical protein
VVAGPRSCEEDGSVEVDAVGREVFGEHAAHGVEVRRVLVLGDGGEHGSADTGIGEVRGCLVGFGAQPPRHADGMDVDVAETGSREDVRHDVGSDRANIPGPAPAGSGGVP